MTTHPDPPVSDPHPRPGDLARVLLAGRGGPPRSRARDQQADLAGEALSRDMLRRLVVLDPEPEDLESALVSIVAALGEPSGPARAVGLSIRQEWEMVVANPAYWSFLVREAIGSDEARPPRSFRFPDQSASGGRSA